MTVEPRCNKYDYATLVVEEIRDQSGEDRSSLQNRLDSPFSFLHDCLQKGKKLYCIPNFLCITLMSYELIHQYYGNQDYHHFNSSSKLTPMQLHAAIKSQLNWILPKSGPISIFNSLYSWESDEGEDLCIRLVILQFQTQEIIPYL